MAKPKKLRSIKKKGYRSTLNVEVAELKQLKQLKQLNNLSNLTTKQKILYYSYNEELSVSDLAKKVISSVANVMMAISNENRNDGLLNYNLLKISKVEGKTKFYKSTNKGRAEIDILIQEQKKQEELILLEDSRINEIDEQIKLFRKFIELYYKAELLDSIRVGNHYFVFKFTDLVKFNSALSEQLLEKPEEIIKVIQIVIKDFNEKIRKFNVRFADLPLSSCINIGEIRAAHLGKFISVKGIPLMSSDVRPQIVMAKFECPSCGNILSVLQLDTKYKEPSRCGCGRKGKFREISKELVDGQGLVIEEPLEELGKRINPKRLNVFLKDDLTAVKYQPSYEESKPIIINGWLSEVPIQLRHGGLATKYDLILEANYVDNGHTEKIKLTKKEIKELKKIGIKKIIDSFCPHLKKLKRYKTGIILSALSGGGNHDSRKRDDSHLLIVGDPGVSKTQLLREVYHLFDCCRWISSNEATAAGLIGTVDKNDFLGEKIISKGALPMANQGIVLCDEFDKMKKKDIMALHEPLESPQKYTINKWGKSGEGRTDCVFIAAANPKHGRFIIDENSELMRQVELPNAIINRFDLILVILDTPDVARDKEIADAILGFDSDKKNEELIDEETLSKYLNYARTLKPVISKKAKEKLRHFYLSKRQKSGNIIQINTRQLQGLERLTKAAAKLRLSEKADCVDSKLAIDLVTDFFDTFLLDKVTGKYDIDLLENNLSGTERIIYKFILKAPGINLDDLFSKLDKITREKFDLIVKKMLKAGIIFEPVKGKVARL